MLLLALPNVALTYLVVAVAGLAYGARLGAAVGGLTMVLTSLALTGPTPGLLPGAAAMALLGGVAGLLGRTAFPGPAGPRAALLAGALGAALQVTFSLAADLGTWLLFAWLPEGAAAWPLLPASLLAGLAFNVPAAVFQAALFAGALAPVLEALRSAGLAPAPRARRRALREVVLADLPARAPEAT
jgi:hypothetical protein